MTKRIHYLQHVHFEGLGYIETWVKKKNFSVSSTRLFESEKLPGIDDFDWLIVMGGSMSVNDVDEFPWLCGEIEFIREAVKAKKTVLGICLGAQLIAKALDAKVFSGDYKEIGWCEIQPYAMSERHRLHSLFAENQLVFQWHGDSFELPKGAVGLACSRAYANQAFVYNDTVVALQFHLEATEESIAALLEYSASDITSGIFVQSAEAILKKIGNVTAVNKAMKRLLEYLDSTV